MPDPHPIEAAYTVTPAQHAEYAERGCVTIRGLLPAALAATLLDRVDGMLEGRYPSAGFKCGMASNEGPDDPGRRIKQVAPLAYDPIPDAVLAAYAAHATLLSVAAQLMGAAGARVFQQQALVKEPGEANGTPWHQDEHYWQLAARGHDAVTAWMPLLPTSAATGTMWLMPGSQREGLLPHAAADGISRFMAIQTPLDETRLIPLELDPGDVSFHHRDMVHGAYANSGRTRRVAIAQHYRSEPPRAVARSGG